MLLYVSYEVFVAFSDSCRAVKCTFMLCELLSGCPSEVVVPCWAFTSGCPSICIVLLSMNNLDVPVRCWCPIGPRCLDVPV